MRGPDVLVIGGGVFGLSVGWAARRRGMTVQVLEAGRVGGGASGGPVGALVPHAPARWSPLHAFQLAALAALPGHVAGVEAAAGRGTGYARTGRLTPVGTAEARGRAEADAAAAAVRWGGAGRLEVLDTPPPEARGWLAPDAAAHGVLRDTLSARIDPPAYLAALAACLGDALGEGVHARVDPGGAAAVTATGRVHAGHVVVAAGWRTWQLVRPFAPGLAGPAVKGQAALLATDPGLRPVITGPGLYIVAHAEGVAVGSTSETEYADGTATDGQLDALIERARRLCPALAAAPVTRRWAGLRPKPPGRTPVAGPLPGHPRLWVAGGGFRIGLGIAHAIAEALVAEIAGETAAVPLPPAFRPCAQG